MLKQLAYTVTTRLLDWFTRPRSGGIALLKYGALVVVTTLGADLAVQVARQSVKEGWSFSFATGQGIPLWATLLCAGVGLLMILVGMFILVTEFFRERRRRLVVIELRGLHSSPDTPAVDKVVPTFRGDRRHLLLDFRPHGPGSLVDPAHLLERISSMKSTLQTLVEGTDKRDVQVAVGGLASVPALFLAGFLLDDESHVHLYDWDRNAKSWRAIDGPDDDDRFLPLDGLASVDSTKDVILVVEASYAVNQTDISASFDTDLPVLRLRVTNPLADRFWSEEKQRALTAAFRDAVQLISAEGVKTIHLVAVAPASLCLRMGMSYEKRLFPTLVVYQFEKSSAKPYPWGVQFWHGHNPCVIQNV
ncbi:MAG: SAVED domain-containing protein [Candidatus Nitrotoga sp.]|nr:SAVED domain-containing protein [Candidatus Nitrotoga sp.]MDO9448081.1 SAVED domain-containing protein [Candidatus Nitrotoga sp.]